MSQIKELIKWIDEMNSSPFILIASETEIKMLDQFKAKCVSLLPKQSPLLINGEEMVRDKIITALLPIRIKNEIERDCIGSIVESTPVITGREMSINLLMKLIRQHAIGFVEEIREYERENHISIGFDDRTTEDFYEIYINQV